MRAALAWVAMLTFCAAFWVGLYFWPEAAGVVLAAALVVFLAIDVVRLVRRGDDLDQHFYEAKRAIEEARGAQALKDEIAFNNVINAEFGGVWPNSAGALE